MNGRSKVYVDGSRSDIRVPFTEVELSDGDPPVRLYDTSGPGSDPEVGPAAAARRLDRRAGRRRRPASASGNGDRTRADPPSSTTPAGRRHPRDGVRRGPRRRRPRVRARRDRRRPRHPARKRQPPRDRADGHRQERSWSRSTPTSARRRCPLRRRGGGEAHLGHQVGRRHGDGPLHRQAHPRDPRGDHPQLAGPHRDRPDLPGPGEGRRRPAEADLGGVPGHHHRAGRAGRRLHDRPRRRAAAATCRSPPTGSPASSPAAARSWPPGAWPTTRRTSSTRTSASCARSSRSTTSRSPSATACGPARSPTPTTRPSSPSCGPSAS